MRRTCLIFISCSKTAFFYLPLCSFPASWGLDVRKTKDIVYTFGDQQTTQGYVSYIGFSAYFGFVRTFICKIVTNNVHAFPTTLYRCKSISPFRWRSVSSLIVTNFLYNLFNCNVSARKFLHRRPIIFFAILFTSCSCRAHKHRIFNEIMTFTTSYFLHDLQVDLAW